MKVNAAEMVRVAEFVEERWDRPGPWKRVTAFWTDFAGLEAEDVWEAIRRIYRSGSRSAPSPSELVAAADEIARSKGRRQLATEHKGRHTWAIVEETEDGRRLGVCVVCRDERWFGVGELLTDSERVEGALRRRIVNPEDDPTQNLAR